MDYSPLGSSVHGTIQARILAWVAISSFRGYSQPRVQIHVSCVSCIGRQVVYHWASWEAQTSFRFPIIPSFRRSYQDGVWDRAWGKDVRGRCSFFRRIQKPSMATDSGWMGMLSQLPLLWTPQLTTWFLWPSVSPSITKGYVLLFPDKWIGTDDSCEVALVRLHQSGVKLLGFEAYLHRLLASPLTSVALETLLNHSVLCFPRLSRAYGVLVRIRWAHKYKALRSLCGMQ